MGLVKMRWSSFLKRNKVQPEPSAVRAEAQPKKEVKRVTKAKVKVAPVSAEEALKAQEKADKELKAAKIKDMVIK